MTGRCLALMLAGWVAAVPSPLPGEEGPESPTTLRILTHNVYMGFSKGNAAHHPRWREWVAEQKPDVTALQELNGYTTEKLAADAAAWGHPHSALLKEDGFPVGLTSRWPIEDVVRLRKGFHHGILRGRVRGVFVYAIHFHPSDWERRIQEAALLAEDIASLPAGDRPIVLAGDFNGFSPADREHYDHTPALVPFFASLDGRDPGARNLRDGRIDDGGIQAILDQGFVDLQASVRGVGGPFLGTFPSSLVRGEDHGPDRRLDYIFASASLAGRVKSVRLCRDDETALFSDHFPVMAELEWPRTGAGPGR